MKKLTNKKLAELEEAERARSVNLMFHHVHVLSVNDYLYFSVYSSIIL